MSIIFYTALMIGLGSLFCLFMGVSLELVRCIAASKRIQREKAKLMKAVNELFKTK